MDRYHDELARFCARTLGFEYEEEEFSQDEVDYGESPSHRRSRLSPAKRAKIDRHPIENAIQRDSIIKRLPKDILEHVLEFVGFKPCLYLEVGNFSRSLRITMLHSTKFKTTLSKNGVTSTEIHHALKSVEKLAANYLMDYFHTFTVMDATIKVQKGPSREYSTDDFPPLCRLHARPEYYRVWNEVHSRTCGQEYFYEYLDLLVSRYANIRSCAKPEK
jgi:hypothetical protein